MSTGVNFDGADGDFFLAGMALLGFARSGMTYSRGGETGRRILPDLVCLHKSSAFFAADLTHNSTLRCEKRTRRGGQKAPQTERQQPVFVG
jgi:hypothetical protein